MIISVLLIVFAFFIGAIPFGYIITKRFFGINIQKVGSGNIGSTNVKRIVGKKVGYITQILLRHRENI